MPWRKNPHSRLSRAFFPEVEAFVPAAGAHALSITFVGESARRPVLASLVRQFDVEVNIFGGSIQQVAGQRIGRLQLELSGKHSLPAIEYLQAQGLQVEVL